MENLQTLEDALRMLQALNRQEAKQRRQERQARKAQKLEFLSNAQAFEIHLHYQGKNWNGLRHEAIELEGWKNAQDIFMRYREIGHSLKLNFMALYAEGKKQHKVTFKY